MVDDEQDSRRKEISRWLVAWTEQNAIPRTLPEDSKPCIEAIDRKADCLADANEFGYSEEELCAVDFVEGDLGMFFDGVLRKKFFGNTAR
ncbi:hypothetical protein [Methylobacterium tarhaniae]|uniref:hypothetical protein n=1 Tax=Methylobacterium tarhaniae TaxID=1187852 RepID=UPI003D05EB65